MRSVECRRTSDLLAIFPEAYCARNDSCAATDFAAPTTRLVTDFFFAFLAMLAPQSFGFL